jgi:iron complex transport system permease protein
MLRSDEMVTRALSFLLGGSPSTGWEPVIATLPYFAFGLTALALCGHPLNVLQFGEEQARQMGLSVELVKRVILVLASLNTAVAVAFSGIIGFVGLIIPHLLRIIWGPDYRHLIPLSMVGGATGLLIADVGARVLIAPQSLPVGIVTSLIGAPFFLWILRRAKKEVFW